MHLLQLSCSSSGPFLEMKGSHLNLLLGTRWRVEMNAFPSIIPHLYSCSPVVKVFRWNKQ
jgi:hypothetical protein